MKIVKWMAYISGVVSVFGFLVTILGIVWRDSQNSQYIRDQISSFSHTILLLQKQQRQDNITLIGLTKNQSAISQKLSDLVSRVDRLEDLHEK